MLDLQELKERVRDHNDIVDVISQYVSLKKAGKEWKGLCPFHNDRKPSFTVSPQLQIYKCYACGEGGDVFTFIAKRENLDFMGAMEFLARRANIAFERNATSPEQVSERERMFEANDVAARFFKDRLTRSAVAQEYVVKRALLRETVEQFQIGYAPDEWQELTGYMESHGVDLGLCARLGLVKARETGGFYDAYRNRLMFPIQDINGRIIAYGGRALGDDPAKYLNSPQSDLFDKSRTLYGLHFARKKLSGSVPAVFVEGYLDVVTAHQAGFTQCVATLGTAMTEQHARILARYNPKVVICYDADAAGIKATLRGASIWEALDIEGAELRVAQLPEGDDPDSILRRGDAAAFQSALDAAVPRVQFQIELVLKRHNTATERGRDAALAEIVPILGSVPSLISREHYAQLAARLHPAHRYNIGRAIEQIMADAESYSRRHPGKPEGRDAGYPLTQQANGTPLAGRPAPPAYRRPEKGAAEGGWAKQPYDSGARGGGAGQRGGRYARPEQRIQPPPVETPQLSGAEKAERQLLRALFSAQWRLFILSRLRPEMLVTENGRTLYTLIAETTADEDGSVNPARIFRAAQAREAAAAQADERAQQQPVPLVVPPAVAQAKEMAQRQLISPVAPPAAADHPQSRPAPAVAPPPAGYQPQSRMAPSTAGYQLPNVPASAADAQPPANAADVSSSGYSLADDPFADAPPNASTAEPLPPGYSAAPSTSAATAAQPRHAEALPPGYAVADDPFAADVPSTSAGDALLPSAHAATAPSTSDADAALPSAHTTDAPPNASAAESLPPGYAAADDPFAADPVPPGYAVADDPFAADAPPPGYPVAPRAGYPVADDPFTEDAAQFLNENPTPSEEQSPFADDPEGAAFFARPDPEPLRAPMQRISETLQDCSEFLRELLQDSSFLVSNQLLNEAAVTDCFARLERFKQEQTQRELAEMLIAADNLPPEQRRALLEQYQEKARASRGSHSDSEPA